ncbi:MAG: STAS domain-containing protein [Candidatus Marinimicrobia bacterium]|nr:STAS domain-containing protein [Candidatus Neomarinimicrobiota bacterium]
MTITFEQQSDVLIGRMTGRLDSVNANETSEILCSQVNSGAYRIVLDMTNVDYLSSAGIRVLLTLKKMIVKLNGDVKLAGVQPYPLSILKISGFLTIFSIYTTIESALTSFCTEKTEKGTEAVTFDEFQMANAVWRVYPRSQEPTRIRVSGDNRDFLYARCSRAGIASTSLSKIKYSLGIGAMGDTVENCYDRIGELMVLNGALIWVPTDGHNVPDFLIPRGEADDVKIHTAFHVMLDDNFNEVVAFEATDKQEGLSLKNLYLELFCLARQRKPDFSGLIGIVMRADVDSIFGAGIKRAPIIENAPANGESITHRDNIKDWLNFQIEPEYVNTTALVVGVGLDVRSSLDPATVQSIFTVDQQVMRTPLTHSHSAIFQFLPSGQHPIQLDAEIKEIIENGEFLGMEHLLDKSTFKKGVIGLCYIREIVREKAETV